MSASRRKRAKKSPSKPKSAQPSKLAKSTPFLQPPKSPQPAPSSVSASLADSTPAKSGGSRSARRSTPALPCDRAAAIREADDRQARFVAGVATLAFAVGVVFFFAGKTSRRLDPPSKPGAATISTPQKLADAVAAEVEKARSDVSRRRRAIVETSVKTAANAAAPDDVNDKTDFNAASVAESGAKTDSSAADADVVPTAETLAFVVELNSASKAELTNLPRVGEKLAERIIERREELGGFRSVDDLLGVKGIGEKTLDKMRPFCVVAPLDEVK